MKTNSEVDRIKQIVLARTARALFAGDLASLDRIPLEMRPKNSQASRCCIHKDRALLRYRTMAALGFRAEDEIDELKPLATYAAEIHERTKNPEPFISVMSDGCSACLESQTTVTNLCRGCLAKSCMLNCPKHAIHLKNKHAEIDRSLCINCGLCAKVCRFHAIVQVPLACFEACPVGAVGKSDDGRVTINHDLCIRCGRCQNACPFGAITSASQMADVILKLTAGEEVIALTAPALTGIFPVPREQLNGALKALGFSAVYDVANGADETTRDEAAEFIERMNAGAPFMTTSCCPAWVEAVHRVLPELKEYVSTTASPMRYTARQARSKHPDATLVFIGPCAAKRSEANRHGEPNHVITADELGAMLIAKNIQLDTCESIAFENGSGSAYGIRFAVSGGVADSVQVKDKDVLEVKPYAVNGLSPKAIKLLQVFAKTKKAPGNLVEVMGCEGGCSAGPCSFEDGARAAQRIISASAATS